MKSYKYLAAVAAVSIALGLSASPASAQLLGGVTEAVGGLLGGGDGGGGGGGGSDPGSTVGSVVESVVPGGVDTGTVGISGLAEVSFTSNSGGTNVGGTLLGGGGGDLNLPLGGNSGALIDLPGLLGVIGTPGPQGPAGPPGANGGNGSNGGNGRNGISGSNGTNGLNGINGSRLRALIKILENRAWMRFALNNKICLPQFGVKSVAGMVRPNEMGQLQQVLAAYGSDIATLQQMMKKCRNGQNQMVDVGRVIGVDLKDNGQIVVMTI